MSDKPIPERWQSEKRCCSVCDARKICHVCGEQTLMACSDCRINFGVTVYVCKKSVCRDWHEIKCYGDGSRALAAEAALSEATESKNDVAQRWLNDASEKSEIIASLQQQLSEAQQERDEFRERLKSMREANASLVEQRAVSALQVTQQAATIRELAAILKAVEWCAIRTSESESTGAIHRYYCCPVCRVDQHIGIHGCSCDIGKALASLPK